MKKSTLLILVFAIVSITIGCRSSSPSNPNQGFLVIGQARVYSASNPYVYMDYPTGGRYEGLFVSGPGTYGTVSNFNVIESFGTHNVPGAKVPGNWNLALSGNLAIGSLCRGTGTRTVSVGLGSQETVICPGGFYAFAVYPDSMDAFNPPSTIKITGSGIEDTYGAPTIAVYNEFGSVAASSTAVQTLGADGLPHSGPGIEGVTFNGLNLSQVYDGTYSIVVNNVNSDGTWSNAGTGIVTIYGNPPPPPDPGDLGGGGCEPQPRDQPQLECPPSN